MNKLVKFSFISLTYLILAGGIIAYSYLNRSTIRLNKGTYLNTPKPISPFALTEQNGQLFTEKQLSHHWSLIFFGFSTCPSVCPTLMQTLNKTYSILKSRDLQIIFISVDPKHDSLQQLKQFISKFNTQFIALRGNMSLINEMQKKLGVTLSTIPMSHGLEIVLVNPKAEVQAYFYYPITPEDLALDLQKIF